MNYEPRLLKVAYRGDSELDFIYELALVSFDDKGSPIDFKRVNISKKREYRDILREALSKEAVSFFYENGSFTMDLNKAFWSWERTDPDEELYAVYGGD